MRTPPASALFAILIASTAGAGINPVPAEVSQKLGEIRAQRISAEKALVEAEQAKKSTEDQLRRLKALQKLQTREKALTEKRLKKLEGYLAELEDRKKAVEKRVEESKLAVRKALAKLIPPVVARSEELIRGGEGSGALVLRGKIVSSVAAQDLKELESLRVDLEDAAEIASRIEQEKQQIASLLQDVSEQESLILFHRKIREDLSAERQDELLRELDRYRSLKTSEVEIERRISDFEGRQKIEAEKDQLRKGSRMVLRPKSLPWPLRGKVVGTYGQRRDPKTGLNIFSKGIEIATVQDNAGVQSVMEGRVQYSGEIPGKGKVLILEHSDSIYSIYGGLRELVRGKGDEVRAAENLGFLESEQPLYFEIRSGNIAIDPVKWLQ